MPRKYLRYFLALIYHLANFFYKYFSKLEFLDFRSNNNSVLCIITK